METAFGLTEYASGEKIDTIPCLLKELYSDFIVQEILADGTVLKFPDVSEVQEKTGKAPIEIDNSIAKPDCISDEQVALFDARFLEKGEPVAVSTENISKENRKLVHQYIRERYCGRLITETKENNILVSHGHTKSSRKRKIWDANLPKECHFTMSKENKDTSYAIGIIAKFLNVNPNLLRTHGIKDKRGVTAQRVSVRQVTEQKILDLNSTLRQIVLSDCSYHDDPVQMGAHWGNRFSIILRNLPTDSIETLNKRLVSFQKNGFINYFGTQRFGSREANTAEIGRLILKREWEQAVRLILKNTLPYHLEGGSVGAAIRCFEQTGDAKQAMSKLRGAQSFATIEGAILKCLSKGGTWQKCITEAIPIHTRSLYVHAYQSLLWNRAASRRMREFGCVVHSDDVGADGKTLPANASHYDIHIPLPGENAAFAESYGMKWIEEMLKEDGIAPESFTSLQDRFSLGESSRALFVEPRNLESKFINYTEPRAYLQGGLSTKPIAESEMTGPLLALQIQFSLISGSYATVALREITGEDMGKSSMMAASLKSRQENNIEKPEETDKVVEAEEVKEEPKIES